MPATKVKYSQITLNAPQGYLLNGKIVPSIASNNLTVAIKNLAGNDPSPSDPVIVRIGDTVRSITAALSVTKNAGTNWFNAGSSSLATLECDYFVYLGYNATDGVVIGFSRYPGAHEYSEFSTTSTDNKYCAISTIANAAAGDDYEVIGRFAATLSAGAGYTWSVPTFTNINLIQTPIRSSRWLNWIPVYQGGTAPTFSSTTSSYRLNYRTLEINSRSNNSSGGTAGSGANNIECILPMTPDTTYIGTDGGGCGMGLYINGGSTAFVMPTVASATGMGFRTVSSAMMTSATLNDANVRYMMWWAICKI